MIFDCDGVLADTEATADAVCVAFLASHGLHYTHAAFRAKYLGLGGGTFRAALNAARLEALGAPFEPEVLDRLRAEVTAAILRDVRPVPGGPELARRVRAPKAVASSSPGDELRGKLEQLGLTAAFGPFVFSIDDVARSKPDPDLFLLAAERLGTPPERCRVVEDSPNGVRAACAAGMWVIGFTGSAPDPFEHGRELTAVGAHALAADMGEVELRLRNKGVQLDG